MKKHLFSSKRRIPTTLLFIKKHIPRLITVVFRAKSEVSQNYPGGNFHYIGSCSDYIGVSHDNYRYSRIYIPGNFGHSPKKPGFPRFDLFPGHSHFFFSLEGAKTRSFSRCYSDRLHRGFTDRLTNYPGRSRIMGDE